MRVLIYGAGVLGCQLAHTLQQTKHDITLLARGSWKENIDKNGLLIRHYIQRKTSVDRILNSLITIVMIEFKMDILLVKSVATLMYLLRCPVVYYFIKKY